MSCIGGSSSAASNKRKGKEIVVDEVPEEKQQVSKGKEIVVDELPEEKQQQLSKGKEIVPEESSDDDDSDLDPYPDFYSDSDPMSDSDSDDEDDQGRKKKPAWLDTLLRTKFWDPCKEHGSKNRADQCMFCLKCFKVTCPRCTHSKPGHFLLKIRRYVYRSVVHASDMQELGIDVSRIQTYVINARKVLHLRPMNRSKHFRPQAGTPRCITCRTWLRSTPNLYCSLVCEGNVDVSQDDFSGPEAEIRYRSLQVHMAGPSEAAAEEIPADPEPLEVEPLEVVPPPLPPAANQNASLRRRARKQAVPARAPFF